MSGTDGFASMGEFLRAVKTAHDGGERDARLGEPVPDPPTAGELALGTPLRLAPRRRRDPAALIRIRAWLRDRYRLGTCRTDRPGPFGFVAGRAFLMTDHALRDA